MGRYDYWDKIVEEMWREEAQMQTSIPKRATIIPDMFAGLNPGEPFNMKWLAEDGVYPTNPNQTKSEVRNMKYEEITQVLPFYGLRVMINPEKMEGYNTSLLGLSGNIFNVKGSEGDIRSILRQYKNEGQYTGGWQVRVRFDNGQTSTIKIRDMLLVNGVHKNVHYFETSESAYYKFNDEYEKMLDKIIIEQGKKIRNHKVYNEEYCRKIFAQA